MKTCFIKRIIILIVVMLSVNQITSQCWFSDLNSKFKDLSPEYQSFLKNNDDGYMAYKALYEDGELAMKNAFTEVKYLAEYISKNKSAIPTLASDINNAGGYKKWKLDNAIDISKTLNSVKNKLKWSDNDITKILNNLKNASNSDELIKLTNDLISDNIDNLEKLKGIKRVLNDIKQSNNPSTINFITQTFKDYSEILLKNKNAFLEPDNFNEVVDLLVKKAGKLDEIQQLKASTFKNFSKNINKAVSSLKSVEGNYIKVVKIWIHNGSKADIQNQLPTLKKLLEKSDITVEVRFDNDYINLFNL